VTAASREEPQNAGADGRGCAGGTRIEPRFSADTVDCSGRWFQHVAGRLRPVKSKCKLQNRSAATRNGGPRKKGATKQLADFDRFCKPADRKHVSMEILDSAASLWVESQRVGRIIGDCDLIIAATAQFVGLGLVTSNTRHFDWIRGLQLFDWRQP
jgi:predicted nucleic acid-binding protein